MDGVQHALQSITHNLPVFVAQAGRAVLGDACYTTLIYDVAPTRLCVRLAVSKALGIGIIIFGSILKIPQILTIIRNRSAWGISLAMYALEVVAYDISLAYAFRKRLPFSTYGENASLTVQNMIITLLIIWYLPFSTSSLSSSASEKGLNGTAFAATTTHHRQRSSILTRPTTTGEQAGQNGKRVIAATIAMLCGSVFLFILCPSGFLSVLQAFSIPISLLSKFPQIRELHQNKQCGHLSAIVVFAQLAGTIARVFTTITETGDWLLGLGFGLASVLNFVIAVQYVRYWKNGKDKQRTTLPLTTAPQPRSVSGRIWTSPTVHRNVSSVNGTKYHEGNAQSLNGGLSSITIFDSKNPSTLSSTSSNTYSSSGRQVSDKGHRMD